MSFVQGCNENLSKVYLTEEIMHRYREVQRVTGCKLNVPSVEPSLFLRARTLSLNESLWADFLQQCIDVTKAAKCNHIGKGESVIPRCRP